jgi:hypothetical protein
MVGSKLVGSQGCPQGVQAISRGGLALWIAKPVEGSLGGGKPEMVEAQGCPKFSKGKAMILKAWRGGAEERKAVGKALGVRKPRCGYSQKAKP